MGMHPYGKPRYVDKIYEILHVAEDGSLWHDMRYFQYHHSTDDTLARRSRSTSAARPRPEAAGQDARPFYCDMAARSSG
jgi:carbamoyltransferase